MAFAANIFFWQPRSKRREITMQTVTQFEKVITEFRHMLPKNTATAQAIDQHEPWEQIAIKAIDDGYIENADEFVRFVEACLRRSS
jgi:hypothetical protein